MVLRSGFPRIGLALALVLPIESFVGRTGVRNGLRNGQ